MSVDRWMEKEDVVYVSNGILLSHKKNEITPLAVTWRDLEIILLSKSDRERHISYDNTPRNLKKKKKWDEWIYKTEMNSQT